MLDFFKIQKYFNQKPFCIEWKSMKLFSIFCIVYCILSEVKTSHISKKIKTLLSPYEGKVTCFLYIIDFLLGYIFEPRAIFQRSRQRCVRIACHLEIGKKKMAIVSVSS